MSITLQAHIRRVFCVLFSAGLISLTQGQSVYIKGIVTDTSLSAKPIANAIVRLVGAKLADTTDAFGKFTLASASSVQIPSRINTASGYVNIVSKGFYITTSKKQSALISIFNAAGKTVIHQSLQLSAGSTFIKSPRLPDGIYVLSTTLSQVKITSKFITTDAGIAYSINKTQNDQNGTATSSAMSVAAIFSDTIEVRAKTYNAAHKSVTNGLDSTMKIKMTSNVISCTQTPVDPKATSAAKNLLCYLKTHAYITGQVDIPDIEKVKTITGKYPAICGFDGYGCAKDAIDWAKNRKGIIAWQWHWACPYGGDHKAPCDNFVNELDKPGSLLWTDIDKTMKAMKEIQDAGFAVVFRPLHEANDNYFWWTKKGADTYKKLWRLLYARAQFFDVHNLLWAFNGMPNTQGYRKPMADFYPGNDVVDLITTDYFATQTDMNICKNMGNNKTLAVPETFNPLDPAKEPAWSFSVVWASRDWNSDGRVQKMWKTTMDNEKSIILDELPDMSDW
jgi:hypothetical protein